MKFRYFDDTDTLYIEFTTARVHETRELDEATLMESMSMGNSAH